MLNQFVVSRGHTVTGHVIEMYAGATNETVGTIMFLVWMFYRLLLMDKGFSNNYQEHQWQFDFTTSMLDGCQLV